MNSITEISERLNSMIKVVRFGKSKFHPEVEFTFANENGKIIVKNRLTDGETYNIIGFVL